jgi:signal transduction histidine kinase
MQQLVPDSFFRFVSSFHKALICLSLLLCFLFMLPAAGQPLNNTNYRIRHFTDEDGLPQNSIKSIVPDKDGFVWLATEFGLVRFDGTNFHAYKGSNGSLLTNRLVYLLPSGIAGKTVAVTGNRELIWANETTGIVSNPSIRNNIYLKGHLSPNPIYTTIGLPNLFTVQTPDKYYAIPLDTAAYYLMSRDSVLFYQNHALQYSHAITGKEGLRFFEVGGHLYYWEGKGLPLLFKRDTVKNVKITGELLQDAAYRANRSAVKVYWNINTRQLFFYLGGALYIVNTTDDGSLHTQAVLQGFDMEEHEIISVSYNEINRRVFLGSFTQGLFVARPYDFDMVQSSEKGDDLYYAQAVYANDKVITPHGYILGPAAAGKKMPVFKGLMTDDQYSMLIAADKTVWVKFGGHVYQLNADGTAMLNHWELEREVTQLYEDRAGRVFITQRNAGLYYVAPGMKKPEPLLEGKWDVSYIQQQDTDIYWMGTGSGCYRFHLSTRTMDTVPGLKGKYIRSLFVRSPQEIWITTYEEGFFLYDGKLLAKMPMDKNSYLRTAHCILEDNRGFFWITTNKGLFQAAREDLLRYAYGQQKNIYYQYYEKNSGFNSNEFNGGCEPCGVKLPSGYFSFPSLNGLVWFKPDSLQADMPGNELFVDRVEVNLEERNATDTMRLDDEARRIKFFVTTPYYGNNYNLGIEYALLQDSRDSVWLPIEADRSITLSSLSSGVHQLLIRKLSGFGKDNYTYKSLTLVVPPLFYEKTWFRVLQVVAGILLIWGYVTFRIRYIRNKNRLLEARIADRTKELEKTMLALQDSEHDLRRQTRIQDRLITAMAHDIKSPLKFMADSAKRIVGRLNRTGMEQEQEEAQVLFESGTRVYYYTENLLQYIRSQMKDNKVVIKPVNLFQLVQEKVNIFQTIAAEQRTEIVNLLPADLIINSHANLLGVVMHNLLDNAVKITIEGRIVLEAFREGTQCILSIRDTGMGMRPALLEWCNAEPGDDGVQQGPGHMGLGLLIVKDLLPLIKGRLFVQLADEKGTDVRVIISDAFVI